MDFLKTKDISYAVDKEAYGKYFRSFADQSRVYVASEEERAADATASRCGRGVAAPGAWVVWCRGAPLAWVLCRAQKDRGSVRHPTAQPLPGGSCPQPHTSTPKPDPRPRTLQTATLPAARSAAALIAAGVVLGPVAVFAAYALGR
jgi:hypothetical protein